MVDINPDRYESDLTDAQLETLAVRGGQHRTGEHEQSEPVFMSSSYVFSSASEAAAVFGGEREGNVYSRYTNPTVRTFEERIALLEGAEAAVATSSGMAAIMAVCMSQLSAGDSVVMSRNVFGATTTIFKNYLKKFGVETVFVDLTDLNSWQAALLPSTKLLFLETPSNPLGEVVDLKALAKMAHDQGALLVVDNCFSTPILQQPLKLGADIVVHSATKYIDGQGRAMGGVACGRKAEMDKVVAYLRATGPTMSPFNAWIFLKGLETLSLRVRAHCANAQTLAEWLQQQPQVTKVHYAGLPTHPQHELAKSQQSGFGGVVAFEVDGGREAAWRVIDNTRMVSITANLGDTRTTITHPASTTHTKVPPEERLKAGIKENLVRVALGLEHIDDIKADIKRALASLDQTA